MDQYNMILPDTNKIYFETNPKNVALKVFRKLNKNKINQSRIIFENNSTKKKYEYIAMTKNKFDKYKKLNSLQIGGSNDKEFLNQLKKISNDLEISFSEFKKIINSKIKPETNNNEIFVKVIDQLDNLDNKVEVLSKQFNLTPTNKNASTSISDSIKNIESNIEQIINIQKQTNEKIKETTSSNYCTIS
jgi:predicted DNA-binding ArsR family transcriptional regulator